MAIMRVVGRTEKRANDIEGKLAANHPRTDTEHVHVVMLDTLVGRVGVMANRRANAGDFVSRNADADPAATDQNAAIRLAADDLASDGFSKVGIITTSLIVRSTIDHASDGNAQVRTADQFHNQLFERESGMIAADGDAKGSGRRHGTLGGLKQWVVMKDDDLTIQVQQFSRFRTAC